MSPDTIGDDLLRDSATVLRSHGFAPERATRTGQLYRHGNHRAVLLESGTCDLRELPYVEYTSEQNFLMHEAGGLFRFLLDEPEDQETLRADLPRLLEGDWDLDSMRQHGANRAAAHPDPTPPEQDFEEAFVESFGDAALFALRREFAAIDLRGTYRPVDYLLRTDGRDYAIELNGEQFHHPAAIGPVRYRSQLLKQNSLVGMGIPVFRWSRFGMHDRERFVEELRMFFGQVEHFSRKPSYEARRSVAIVGLTSSTDPQYGTVVPGTEPAAATTSPALHDSAVTIWELGGVELRPHQIAALEQIESERSAGRNAFLVVLPTGTGKTEVAIADFQRRKTVHPRLNGLFLVPTRQLRHDTLDRLHQRLPALNHGSLPIPPGEAAGFTVHTYAQALRNPAAIGSDAFGFIAIDEAHHTMAPGLAGLVRRFAPETLLGLTATPERLDQKKLSEVFGTYETALPLEDAIRQGIVPPVRVFRVETNVDLSEVLFRGQDYVASDLQKAVQVPSRDRIVADTLQRYFGTDWRGGGMLVFCVNVDHAERMATILGERGFRAAAVTGRDSDAAAAAVEDYRQRRLQVLCACSLLSEGFDAPETSVVVMARPTLSKALYTQQLGRGTRWAEGKEALYVLDVVDRYGPLNAPWTAHALFGVTRYFPFANLIGPNRTGRQESEEQRLLIELLEYERRIEEVDLFTFERVYADHLSDEQMARELFITTGTLRDWVRRGEVTPRVQVPFGRRVLNYYAPEQVAEIRTTRRLRVHDDSTQLEDFREFLDQRDYVFSYKPVLLLSFLKHVDSRGGADLEVVLADFQAFYRKRVADGLPAEKGNAGLSKPEVIENLDEVRRSLLANPFEKFERKRFMHHAKDLGRIEFALGVWRWLAEEPSAADSIRKQMLTDLAQYYEPLGGIRDAEVLADNFTLSSALQSVG
jgi:superfamily II DNA or RNA helicase/DNA-binding transcriptional MerR regulator